jgi:protein O-GlcNAc transferase
MLSRLFAQLFGGRGGEPPIPAGLANVAGAMQRISTGQQAEREGRLDDALASYRDGLDEFPDSAELNAMLGNVLRALDRTDEAIAAYRRACELKPGLAAAWYNLALTEHGLGQAVDAERDYREALRLDPALVRGHSSLLCLLGMGQAGGRPRAPREVFDEHRAWAALHADHFRSERKPFANSREPERRLRIGYVSADLRQHATAGFFEPLLLHRDRTMFEAICYDNSAGSDAVKERLRSLADGWREIKELNDATVADMVRSDRIDLLVDLGGHTEGNRLLVFARKPAPVQASLLGYLNTTGLAAIDYRITDAWADPPGEADRCHVEKLWRLPGSFWCFRTPDNAPEVSPLPALDNGYLTFGSFNNFSKLNHALTDSWIELLKRLPEARLLVVGVPEGAARSAFIARFTSAGVAPHRIQLTGHVPLHEYRILYGRVDVALDAFPYAGGATTCEAMWMGIPVVSVAGGFGFAGSGASILNAAGLPDLLAPDPGRYVEIAVALARDTARLATLRAGLRERVRQSALADGPGMARRLETAYRGMWRSWCMAGPPRGIT